MLGAFLKPEFININLESSSKDELFEEMLEQFVRGGENIDRAAVLDALFERETKMTTGIVEGIAVPHAICPGLEKDLCAVGISRAGIEYGSLDGKPVYVVFMLLFGAENTSTHLKAMQELALILKKPNFVQDIMGLATPQAICELLCKFEEDLA